MGNKQVHAANPQTTPNPSAFSPPLTAPPPLATASTEANNEGVAKVEEASLSNPGVFEDLHKKCKGSYDYMTLKLIETSSAIFFPFLFFFFFFLTDSWSHDGSHIAPLSFSL